MNDEFLQFLGLVKRSGNLLEGYNKCEDGIKRRIIKLLVLSDDCSENTKDKFISYCNKYEVKLIQGYSKENLGKPIGKDEINVLGIVDNNMCNKLISLFNKKNTI